MTDPVDPLALESLRKAMNTEFSVEFDDDRSVLKLTLVALQVRDAPDGYEQFAAHFLGPPDPQLPQATYEFRYPGVGAFPLFIVPIGRDDAGVRYEACVIRRA